MLAAGHAHDHLVLQRQRSAGRGVTSGRGVVVNLGLPKLPAGLGVHRKNMHVKSIHEEAIAQDGQPPIHFAAAIKGSRWIPVPVDP